MDSTPLLSAAHGLPGPNILQDHPAFLRASHSPWRCIPQNVLVILRGIALAYLTATAFMIGHYKFVDIDWDVSKWSMVFDFALISFALTLVYHVITFSWTFTHLYYPDPDDHEGGIESWIVAAMSLPRNMASLRKQFYFTMFYTATCVGCFMNSTIYWFVTRQHDALVGGGNPAPPPPEEPGEGDEMLQVMLRSAIPQIPQIPDAPFSDLFSEGWFMPFIICNLYGVTSIIMVIEMLFFNSIKRPIALGSHLFGLIFLSGAYLGWATIGETLTEWYPFYWLDEFEVGSQEAVIAYCMGFVLLAPTMYALMLGFVGIREGLTRRRSAAQAIADVQESLDS